jgi:hypothetical protein
MNELTWKEVLESNAVETLRLADLVNQCSDAELARPMDAGRTVATVMAHLAFWDIRAAKLLALWQHQDVEYSALDTDLVNEVVRELVIALPARAAANLAVEKARIVDRAIAELEPELIEQIRTVGKNVRLERYIHRRTHLEEIEKALG